MDKTTKKTTFDFDVELHKQLKHAAVETGVSMKDIVAIGVKKWIEENVKK